jgi:hypothetical protein
MLIIDVPEEEARRYATDSPGEYSVPPDVPNAYRTSSRSDTAPAKFEP